MVSYKTIIFKGEIHCFMELNYSLYDEENIFKKKGNKSWGDNLHSYIDFTNWFYVLYYQMLESNKAMSKPNKQG